MHDASYTTQASTKNHGAMTEHGIHKMHGMYGPYQMSREATGTSWTPDSTRMPGMHRIHNNWIFMMHGYLNAVYDHQSGLRGGRDIFSENMLMITTQKDFSCGTLAFRGMFSLEPGTIGACGYPLLLQTGETCNGVTPLIDRQHPHDLLMELAVSYSLMWSDINSFFIYFGLPGEPTVGPPVYIHRFSSVYNPEAPITHHWLDSTHITFGVATVGFVHDWLKIDASFFTGREPDQHRWNFDKPRFDSWAARCSVNFTENFSAQISHAFLKSPEQLEPGMNTHRTTASLIYNVAMDALNWQTTFAWGRNKNVPGHILNGFLLESTVEVNNKHIIFARAEHVAKDELFVLPDIRSDKIFKVGKIDIGYIYELSVVPSINWQLGFVTSLSFVPETIEQVYGGTPWSYMLFLRAELKELL